MEKALFTFSRHQLLNITTGRLWTKMDDIYTFFDSISGSEGIMTHMLPNAMKAFKTTDFCKKEPFSSLPVEGFDPKNTPNDELSFEVTEDDQKQFWKAYSELPSILERIGTR